MKKLAFFLACLMLMCVSACKTGNFAASSGQDDIAYIWLVSSTDNFADKNMTVKVDDSTTFTMKVQRAKQDTERHNGSVHAIMPGARHIEVIDGNGKVVYSKEIFVSSQQTKMITL